MIRARQRGARPCRGGPPGDRYILPVAGLHHLSIATAPICIAGPISMVTAAFGGEVECRPSPAGSNVKCPARHPSSRRFRIATKGMRFSALAPDWPECPSCRGVETPQNLTKKAIRN